MSDRLDNSVALITGSGKGIGAASALALADAGADVVVTARTERDLRTVAAHVEERGRRCLVVPGDVTDLDFLETLVERTIDALGALDVVVHNAGGSMPRALMDTSVGSFERSLQFNVLSPFRLTQLCVPHLEQRPGASIVVIGSMAGVHANRSMMTHSVANAARAQLTRTMAADLAPTIRVNAVLPGAVETSALSGYLDAMPSEVRDRMHARTAMGRNGEPDDIANVVRFLASPAASFMTGKLIEVDGGATDDLFGD